MKEVPYELLKRYSEGVTDDSENRRLMEWLLEDKENEHIFADVMSVVSAAEVVGDERFESRREAFLDCLSKRLDQSEAVTRKRRHRRVIFAFAAGIAAVVALCVLLFPSEKEYFTPPARDYVSYSNTNNDSDIISLPDGSTVWISAGSAVRYSETGKSGQREVVLDGEGFFDVAKDSLKPFVVKTPYLSVVAVGTRFNVRANEGENIEVMLEEGSVRLRNPQGVSLMRLLPDQTATLDVSTGDIFIDQRYVQSEIRLKYNVIALTDATFAEIVEAIEKSYGVSIDIKDAAETDKRYNFCCLKSRGVEEAVAVLSRLTGVECRIGG